MTNAPSQRPVVNPGRVEWTGENPGIWLRQRPGEPYSALVTFFRIVHSPHGAGHAAFVLLDPHGRGDDRHVNACFTDNEELAHYLGERFVARFLAFKDLPGLKALQYRTVDQFEQANYTRSRWIERASGEAVELELVWDGLGEPYFVEIPGDRSPTGHEIFAVFVEASTAAVQVNDYRAPGQPASRDFHGRTASTAFLAFSETWVDRSASWPGE
jgi:hypothetical protein